MAGSKLIQIYRKTERCEKQRVQLRLDVPNRNGRGSGNASLKFGLRYATLPSRNDEVGPDEDVSGKQHAGDELEEEDELLEGLGVG